MDYSHAVLQKSVALIVQSQGFQGINSTALAVLTDLLGRYLKETGVLAHMYAEHDNRTLPTLVDLSYAFKEQHVNPTELLDFAQSVESPVFPDVIPKYPVERPSQLNMLRPGSREVLTRPAHIFEHFPPMYPENEDESMDVEHDANCNTNQRRPSRTAGLQDSPADDRDSSPEPMPGSVMHSVQLTPSGQLLARCEGQMPEALLPDAPLPLLPQAPPTSRVAPTPRALPNTPASLAAQQSLAFARRKQQSLQRLLKYKEKLNKDRKEAQAKGIPFTPKTKSNAGKRPMSHAAVMNIANAKAGAGVDSNMCFTTKHGKSRDKLKPKIPMTPAGTTRMTPGTIMSQKDLAKACVITPSPRPTPSAERPKLKMPAKQPEFSTDVLPRPNEDVKEQEERRLQLIRKEEKQRELAFAAQRGMLGSFMSAGPDGEANKGLVPKIKRKDKDKRPNKDIRKDKTPKPLKDSKSLKKKDEKDKDRKKEKELKKIIKDDKSKDEKSKDIKIKDPFKKDKKKPKKDLLKPSSSSTDEMYRLPKPTAVSELNLNISTSMPSPVLEQAPDKLSIFKKNPKPPRISGLDESNVSLSKTVNSNISQLTDRSADLSGIISSPSVHETPTKTFQAKKRKDIFDDVYGSDESCSPQPKKKKSSSSLEEFKKVSQEFSGSSGIHSMDGFTPIERENSLNRTSILGNILDAEPNRSRTPVADSFTNNSNINSFAHHLGTESFPPHNASPRPTAPEEVPHAPSPHIPGSDAISYFSNPGEREPPRSSLSSSPLSDDSGESQKKEKLLKDKKDRVKKKKDKKDKSEKLEKKLFKDKMKKDKLKKEKKKVKKLGELSSLDSTTPQPVTPKLVITGLAGGAAVTDPPPYDRACSPSPVAKISSLFAPKPSSTPLGRPASSTATPAIKPKSFSKEKLLSSSPIVPPLKIKSTDKPGPSKPSPPVAPKTPKPLVAPKTPKPLVAPKTPRPLVAPKTPRPLLAPKTPKAPTPAPVRSHFFTATGEEVWLCPECRLQDDGQQPMIGCDGCDDWFHWRCVGIAVPPQDEEQWFCRVCVVQEQAKKRKPKRK